MKFQLKGRYKALKDFDFNLKKGLTLITGYNGAGKSQLLSVINQAVGATLGKTEDKYKYIPPQFDCEIELENFQLKENKGHILWNNSYGNSVFLNEITYQDFKEVCIELYVKIHPSERDKALKLLGKEKKKNSIPPSISTIISNNTIQSLINLLSDKIIDSIIESTGKTKEALLVEDIFMNFPAHILIEESPIHTSDNILSFYFYCYQLRVAYEKKKGIASNINIEEPWNVLQEIIDILGFSYKVIAPDIDKILEILNMEWNQLSEKAYKIKLLDLNLDKEISFSELSSGEKQLFSVGMLRYSTELRKNKRQLILLDEPDAHLHPSMIDQFFKIVNEFLVKENGLKVIMTTHSATTLVLASKYDNVDLFFMTRSSEYEPTFLIQDKSFKFSKSIKSLSNGLITIYPETKFIIVEDKDDVEFYNNISDFSEYTHISVLNFIAASDLTEKGEGGKDAVSKVIEHMKKMEVLTRSSSPVIGLIDKDYGNEEFLTNPLINLIERYSIENYWFDPLIVYCVLLNGSKEAFIKIDVLKIKSGEEYLIRKKDTKEIQEQVNVILEEIETNVFFVEGDLQKCQLDKVNKCLQVPISLRELILEKYLNEHDIFIPKWLLETRGKDLRQLYQWTFDSLRTMNKETAYKYFRSTKHIPVELIQKIEKFLQKDEKTTVT